MGRRNLLAFVLLVPISKFIPVHYQLTVPLWIILLVLASQAWMSSQVQIGGNAIMAATATGGALLGGASSLLLCGAYGLASRFPAIYMQVSTRLHNPRHCSQQHVPAQSGYYL